MSSGVPAGRMYLIDALSLIFQVFHAIPVMSSPKGLPTNALFGFTKDLLTLRALKPKYLIVAMDVAGPTFRDQLYKEYKAHRTPMPEDLQSQLPMIEQMLAAMRIPMVGKEGFEADDILATLATEGAKRGLEVFVCTSDKDCRQLIDGCIHLFNLRKNKVLDRAGLLEDWGIAPEQVVDLQVLVGDPVDNVPGVPGIGIKTAAKLLQEFGTLDKLLANIDKVPGAKKQENLRALCGDRLDMCRKLISLDRAVPVERDWDGWQLGDWDAPRLLELFQEWGFHRFADQVRQESVVRGPSSVAATDRVLLQGDLFPGSTNDGRPETTDHEPRTTGTWLANYHLVDTPARFESFLKELTKQKRIALDLETTGLTPRRCEIVGYAFSWKEGEAWYLAVRGPAGEPTLDPSPTLAALRPILEDAKVAKVNQNIKYDKLVLRQHGITLAGVAGDSMIADYLLHAGERSHNMTDLSNRYLDHQVIEITELIGKGKKQLRMDEVPTAKVAEYSGEDADVAWRLCRLLEPKLQAENLKKLYDDLEIPLIEVLAELEFNGVRLDLPLLERLGRDMAQQLDALEGEIHSLAGRKFNIGSPKQLRQILFDELKLPAQRRTGVSGDASTDQETLERLALLGHALPRKILEHRQIAKLKGTYVDALPALVNPNTGRVHASFNQTVAATGRLSSSDPNLQNIPVRTEQGRQIRQAFLPEEGWTLLTADYSQVELRLLAHFSGDSALQQAFAEDRDIHAAVAAQIYGVAEQDVTSAMRRAAKTVNFGVIYGISAVGLAQRLGISKEDGARFIDAYFERYPKVATYQQALLETCRQTQYVGTILGRRRQITGIRPGTTYQQRNQPEREAINMEIQGSAADLIKAAMLSIHRKLKENKSQARMLLQIHDELVFEATPDELNEVAELVEREMTTALSLDVPLKVDLSAGPNWLDVTELKTVAA